MSDQLFERAVRDWLEDGSDRTPRPAIDAVLLAVKTTRQERDLRIPRRFTQMPTYMRLAAGIAIVAVVGVGVLAYFNGGPNIGWATDAGPHDPGDARADAVAALGRSSRSRSPCVRRGGRARRPDRARGLGRRPIQHRQGAGARAAGRHERQVPTADDGVR